MISEGEEKSIFCGELNEEKTKYLLEHPSMKKREHFQNFSWLAQL